MPKRKRTTGSKSRKKTSPWTSSGGGVPRFSTLAAKSANRNVTRLSQAVLVATINVSGSANVFDAYSHALSDLPNYTEYQTVFDEYRFVAIKYTFCCSQVVNTFSTAPATVSVPTLVTCLDTDDASPPSSASLLSHDTAIIHGPTTKAMTRWVQPEAALAAYQGTFAGYAAKSRQWIQTVSSGVQHYGMKLGLYNNSSASSYNMLVFAQYYLEFRKAI